MGDVIRWLPWALSAGALALFLAISPSGFLLAGGWALVILVARVLAGVAGSREGRLTVDAIFTVVCILAAFEGGWYLIPAALAFIVADRRPSPAAQVPVVGPGLELVAGIMAAVVGWLALAIIAWGPLYESRSSTVTPAGALESTTAVLNLAAVGISNRTVVVLVGTAILLAVIAVGAIFHVRFRVRWAHWAVGLAAIGLAAVSVLGAFSIGPFLVPALGLALLAWWAGRDIARGTPT